MSTKILIQPSKIQCKHFYHFKCEFNHFGKNKTTVNHGSYMILDENVSFCEKYLFISKNHDRFGPATIMLVTTLCWWFYHGDSDDVGEIIVMLVTFEM